MWTGALNRGPNPRDPEDEELCVIDAGLRSLAGIDLHPRLRVVNLHCNLLGRIENLLHLRNLNHLDLSSNQITAMQGLDGLMSLRTLNLACNLIQKVKGLENLRYNVQLLS